MLSVSSVLQFLIFSFKLDSISNISGVKFLRLLLESIKASGLVA